MDVEPVVSTKPAGAPTSARSGRDDDPAGGPAGRPPFAWLAVPLIAVAFALTAFAAGAIELIAKSNHEPLAPPLVALACCAWWARRGLTGEALCAWLGVLTAAFLAREIHFDGSDQLLHVTLALLAAWGGFARVALWEQFRRLPGRGPLDGAFASYFLSQVVARRAFQAIPHEHDWHIELEETLETWAHLLMLVAAGRAWWEARRDRPPARAAA